MVNLIKIISGWWFGTAVFAQILPGVRLPLPNFGRFVSILVAMSCNPMEFSQVDIGQSFDLVGKVLVFDLEHSSSITSCKFGMVTPGLHTKGF